MRNSTRSQLYFNKIDPVGKDVYMAAKWSQNATLHSRLLATVSPSVLWHRTRSSARDKGCTPAGGGRGGALCI